MDKETLSNYGWIVICVLVLAVMLALATPFGTFVADAIKSTTQGLFDVNQNALNSTGLINIEGQEFDKCDHDYEVTSSTVNCDTGGSTTHTCKLCGKSYTETTPAGHVFDNATDTSCNACNTTFVSYRFKASDYDSKMGTTTATDEIVVVPETFEYDGNQYRTTSLDQFAFSGCQNLTTVTLPEYITSISNQCFSHCTKLKNIEIPDSVTVISTNAFQDCHSLTSIGPKGSGADIEIPNGVTQISYSAFWKCSGLVSVVFPNNITIIDGSSFASATNLTSIEFPNNLTRIGNSTFSGCTKLSSITLPESLTQIEGYAFSSCTGLSVIVFEGTVEQWNAISLGSNWNKSVPATYVQCSDGQVSLK